MKSFKTRMLFSAMFLVLALSFFVFHSKKENRRIPAATSSVTQPSRELGETWNATDVANSNGILAIIENSLDESTNGARVMRRDAHPKHHGCVMAHMSFNPSGISADEQVGIFAPNAVKEYDAWVRFSNGSPNPNKPDDDGDVRGMAIKLMNVAGTESGSQDFLLMNSKSFFIKDSEEYLDFMKATESTPSLLWFLATHSRTRNVILAARGMKVGNPLHIDYHSATAFKLGNKIVKYSARTCTPPAKRDGVPTKPGLNFLREHLASTLATSDACFDFYVQTSVDSAKMPMEDATVEWDETLSPSKLIGRLVIPAQKNVDSSEQMMFCENLSFDPWHTHSPEMRPLGTINRVRLQVYNEISKKRHEYNKIPQIEPKSLSACSGETEVLCH
jgi:hypothetical protein